MALDFPNSPSVNDSFSAAGKTWVYNGIKWVLLGTSLSQTVKDGSVTQAKLAAFLSAVTVTTTANRSSAVPSPFTGQLVFLTDTKKVQVWDGSLWLNITLAPPEPPTSLSATALSTTSISVAFTAGGANGSPITNYKYALSTNGGSTYGAFTALDPADALTPITISGLTVATTYHIKLKAVNDMGDSVESSATSVATLAIPDPPTNLSQSGATTTTVDISFTAGSDNGYAITNYQYALSTNGGSSYGSFTALDPADASSPITISGLTHSTAYYIKLKAVNSGGAGPESAALSVSTSIAFSVNYLVVAGGGSAGNGGIRSAGSGAGGLRSTVTATGGGCSLETPLSVATGANYAVQVGNGGAQYAQANGGNSVFSTITSLGGGAAGSGDGQPGANGGCGGGAWYNGPGYPYAGTTGQGTACQGFNGKMSSPSGGDPNWAGGGGGGAGSGGGASTSGGSGVAVSITGSSVTYSTGGNANSWPSTYVNANGAANTGNGASGDASGGSGVVILRYPNTRTIAVGAGLTASHTNADAGSGNSYTRITAGSGNVSWS